MKLAVRLSLPSRMNGSRKTATVGGKSLEIRARLCDICVERIIGLVGRNGGESKAIVG